MKFAAFIVCLIAALSLIYFIPIDSVVLQVSTLGYVGVFVAGILYAYTITAAIGLVLLLLFSHTYSLVSILIIASLGLLAGEFLMLRGFGYSLKELQKKKIGTKSPIHQWVKKTNNRLLLMVVGCVILISPIPDEIGIGMLSISKIGVIRFIILSFLMNVISLIILIKVAHFILVH